MNNSESNNSMSLSTSSADISEDILNIFKDFKNKSTDDLATLIQLCKKMIGDTVEMSNQWKWLIRKSIELRFAQANVLHDSTEFESDDLNICGHFFKITNAKNIPTKRLYCDHCTNIIWLFQKSYSCIECSFNTHLKCLKYVNRMCVAVIVAEKGKPEMRICPEVGLYIQMYRCAQCNIQLMNREYNFEPRLCHYSGLYFCKNCHWKEFSIIPANIIHNWDFQQKSVSRQSLQEINLFYEKPVINLEEINPKVFVFVQKLRVAKEKRQILMEMKKYLDVCRFALESKLVNNIVGSRRYIVENSHDYSIYDLVCIENSSLREFLDSLIWNFKSHIFSCKICEGHGFICELCQNKNPIFPFQVEEGIFKCQDCNSCFHRNCITGTNKECPKCLRLKKKLNTTEEVEENETTIS